MKMSHFRVSGSARDSGWITKNQSMLMDYFTDHMKSKGFVPVLDREITLTYSYNAETELFDYEMGRKAIKADASKFMGYLSAEKVLVSNDLDELCNA